MNRRWGVIVIALCCATAAVAQQPQSGGGPDMTHVFDVLGGQQGIVENDDILAIMQYKTDSGVAADLFTLETSNSKFSTDYTPDPVNLNIGLGPTGFAAFQLAWFVDRPNQVLLRFQSNPSENGWDINILDPVTKEDVGFGLGSPFNPLHLGLLRNYVNRTRIVLGNFAGNGYQQALVVYGGTSSYGEFTQFAVIGARDPQNPSAGVVIGPAPQFQITDNTNFPEDIPIAVGDFDGDGRDEIAIWDSQKIYLFKVDYNTLAMKQVGSIASSADTLVDLAAGKFRTPSKADLVQISQAYQANNSQTMVITPIFINVQADGTLDGNAGQAQSVYQTDPVIKLIAKAAPIQDWSSATDQLIFVADTTSGGILNIGSFDQSMTFTLQSQSPQVTDNHGGCVYDFYVGNFDHQDPAGNHNPALQIATYWVNGGCNADSSNPQPQARIYQVTPVSGNGVQNWLATGDSPWHLETHNFDGMFSARMVIGDVQGRSLRVGAPDKVTIDNHLQPNLVLGLPPMHADWIDTLGKLNDDRHPGCGGDAPCLANLTVIPTKTAPAVGFQSSFNFVSSNADTEQHASTTSWSLGVKVTVADRFQANAFGLAEATAEVRASVGYLHNHSVANKYNTYLSATDSLTFKTGFSDFLLYTRERENFYYYPVIGKKVCPATTPNCSDSEKTPLYIAFSVPDNVLYYPTDSTNEEWYQPVDEPANIFSYPWTLGQLEQENHAQPLTDPNPPSEAVGTFSENYFTGWKERKGQSSTVSATDTISENIDTTYTAGADLSEVFSDKATFSLDLSGSLSFASMDTSKQSIASSTGVTVNNPGFDSDIGQCCSYGFSTYLMGMTPYATPLDTPTQRADVNTTGPLYLAFTTDIMNGNPWWKQAYVFPDLGFNHPARWNWSIADNKVSFNHKGDYSQPGLHPEDDPFYQMKGLFITEKSALNGGNLTGPTISQATAGDQVLLTIRVYNFSPVSTPANATIYVSIWGQESNGTSLLGDGFLIGTTRLASIPGYEVSDAPNWVYATIPFDTSNYGGHKFVFWALVFMVDPDGNLLPEMPGHGLSGNPSNQRYTQITDVPTEDYSNNVGLWGASQLFTIVPAGTQASTVASAEPGGQPPSGGSSLTIDAVTLPPGPLGRDQRARVVVELTAAHTNSRIDLSFFDGDPKHGGMLVADQSVDAIGPEETFGRRALYTPRSCGAHQIYVVAGTIDTTSTYGPVPADVSCPAARKAGAAPVQQ